MRTMNSMRYVAVLALAVFIGMLAGNSRLKAQAVAAGGDKPGSHAVAVMMPTKGNTVTGTLWFDQTPDGVHIHGTISGLAPNTAHGFHIHEFGDLTKDDGTSAGGHFNPTHEKVHGGPGAGPHMAGELGNVKADDTGTATVDITSAELSVSDGDNAIIGRSAVVHAKEDDLTPTANPGARISLGVIGYTKGN
jgi:Cu-Zn family superoxide dismutase